MAKPKIAWTETATKHLKINLKNPKAFKETEINNIRESAMDHFSITYQVTADQLIVMAFRDNRQDPKKLLKSIS